MAEKDGGKKKPAPKKQGSHIMYFTFKVYQYFVCYNYKRSVPKPLTFNSIELNPNDNLIPYHNLIANCPFVWLKCTIFQRRIRLKQMIKKPRIKPRERVRALVEEPRNLVKNKLLVTFEVWHMFNLMSGLRVKKEPTNCSVRIWFEIWERIKGLVQGLKFLQKLLSYKGHDSKG